MRQGSSNKRKRTASEFERHQAHPRDCESCCAVVNNPVKPTPEATPEVLDNAAISAQFKAVTDLCTSLSRENENLMREIKAVILIQKGFASTLVNLTGNLNLLQTDSETIDSDIKQLREDTAALEKANVER